MENKNPASQTEKAGGKVQRGAETKAGDGVCRGEGGVGKTLKGEEAQVELGGGKFKKKRLFRRCPTGKTGARARGGHLQAGGKKLGKKR